MRTVQRWEGQLNLPVRRIHTERGEIISACRAELDAWRQRLELEGQPLQASGDSELPDRDPAVRPDRALSQPLGAGKKAYYIVALVAASVGVAVVAGRGSFARGPRLSVDGVSSSRRLQGETFALSATGLTPSGRVTRWERPPRFPRPGQLISHISDSADERGSLSWSMTVGCEVGDDTYQAGLRDEATGAEANLVTLTVVSNPLCGSQLPDLIAESVAVEPTVVRPGGAIEVRALVRNAGPSRAAATLTAFRVGRSPVRTNTGDCLLGKVETAALEPGAVTDVVFSGTIPRTTPHGTYYVWAIADQTSIMLELKSINNFASSGPLQVGSSILASALAPR